METRSIVNWIAEMSLVLSSVLVLAVVFLLYRSVGSPREPQGALGSLRGLQISLREPS